jgi:hypothetical protein
MSSFLLNIIATMILQAVLWTWSSVKENCLIDSQIIRLFSFCRQGLSHIQSAPNIWMLGKNNFELYRLRFVPAAQPVTVE